MKNATRPTRTAYELGQTIRAVRKSQRLTQKDLASLMGAGSRLLTDIERGKPTAQVGKILLALDLLGIDLLLVERGSDSHG